jgi:nucleotide-binding universal stress UspA family protein
MSGPIERVVVTLDAASENQTAIDTAVRVAARTGMPLHGLFVEDQDLFRLADLPFARQVTIGRGAEPLSAENIALQLRVEAERARHELASAAKRRQVECTFEIARGTTELRIAGASERELMITGGSSRPIAGHFRVEHRWWSSVESPAGPFLLARSLWTAPGSVVILLRDRDAASARLFDTAAQIAAATDSTLAVLCAPQLAGTAGVEQWIAERAATHPVRVQVEVAPPEPAALRERLDQLDCRLVALDAGVVEGGGGGLRSLVERFSCDMLVVP